MKKSTLFIALIGITFGMKAQNTFPSSGNAGIGTTNPSYKLDIRSTIPVIQLKHTSDGVPAYGFLQFSDVNSRMGFIGFGSNLNNSLYLQNDTGGAVVIPAGNVGIGTNTPTAKLDVKGNIFSNAIIAANTYSGYSGGDVTFTTGTGNPASLIFRTASGENMRINSLGNVGIGKIAGSFYKLDVQGVSRSTGVSVVSETGNTRLYAGTSPDNYGYISGYGSNQGQQFRIAADGNSYILGSNVGIGITTPSEKLTVKGKILCEEVEVVLNAAAPDYVFEKYYTGTSALKADYVMPTLEEVEAFTKANKHLPEVPSAKTLQKEGLELKNMSLLLLQKIEELTLYTIEQEKRIKVLEARQ